MNMLSYVLKIVIPVTLIIGSVCFSIFYITISFAELTFDISKFTETERMTTMIVTIVFSLITMGITLENRTK